MKIRINDLARELEVKSKAILDILEEVGVTEKKSHSSSVEDDEAERIRKHFSAKSAPAAKERSGQAEIKPKLDLSRISKPGDVLKLLREREQQQHQPQPPAPQKPAAAAPPPARPAAPPPAAAKPAPPAPAPEKPVAVVTKPAAPVVVVTPPAAKPQPPAPSAPLASASPVAPEKPAAPPAVVVT